MEGKMAKSRNKIIVFITVFLCFSFITVDHVYAQSSTNELETFLGTYRGSYYANQGHTGLTLKVYKESGKYKAEFDFYSVPDNPSVPSGKYVCDISYNMSSNKYYVKGVKWLEKPETYEFVDLEGEYNSNIYAGIVYSTIDSTTFTFNLTKQVEENAPSSWADLTIDSAILQSYVPLELQGKYKNPITRSEFAHLILSGLSLKTGEDFEKVLSDKGISVDYDAFDDTDSYFTAMAYTLKIVNGYGNRKFGPDDLITREQAATMLGNATLIYKGNYYSTNNKIGYNDRDDFSDWAIEGIEFVSTTTNSLDNTSIMSGYNNEFHPKDYYTKEQAIITIYKLLNAPQNSYLSFEKIYKSR